MAKPDVGDPAPDFELEGTHGRFKLSDHRGERVVLLFYPGDDTPVCTRQLCEFRDAWDARGEAAVFGINPWSASKHSAFRQKFSFPFPLLVDTGGKVAKLYNAYAIVLVLSWLFFLLPGSSQVVDPKPPTTTQPAGPGR